VRAEPSEISAKDINDFGIKEILGTGHSSFAGSPKNRRHNIAVGAESVNGILIKPGEEFSLIKTLGDINAESGYLPELVIKDNKTIPEYGGGLCQIGTTVFRATYASGLPVTMRRNHSYRVSYYEPAGTDATIYDPWPDYRFVNDTKNHILIQSRIEGDDIYFEFWGTPDGRTATHTYPVIYNIAKPGPTKIIETEDLKPGEKKCTERAHNGADAYFDYTVEYNKANPPQIIKEKLEANEEVEESDYTIETRFRSHYVPWREVCLVGIDNTKTENASSSEENIVI
jgi:vancomycin resistance protein YoaR